MFLVFVLKKQFGISLCSENLWWAYVFFCRQNDDEIIMLTWIVHENIIICKTSWDTGYDTMSKTSFDFLLKSVPDEWKTWCEIFHNLL